MVLLAPAEVEVGGGTLRMLEGTGDAPGRFGTNGTGGATGGLEGGATGGGATPAGPLGPGPGPPGLPHHPWAGCGRETTTVRATPATSCTRKPQLSFFMAPSSAS